MSGRRGKMSILLVIVVVLAFLTASCGEGEAPTPMTLYESTEHGFSIEYPEGWTENAQELGALFSLSCTEPDGTLSAMVYLEYRTEDVILADYVAEAKEYMESVPELELVSEGDVTIGEGIASYEIVGKGDLGTGEVGQFRTVLLTRGKQGLSVEVTGEPGDFDQRKETIDAIVDSFKLLPTYTYVPPTPSAGGTYTSAGYGFSITYPAGWTEASTGRPTEIVTFISSIGLPGVTVSQSLVAEGTTLAEYGPQFSQELSQHYADYELFSEGSITLDDGTPAYEIVFSGTMEGYFLKSKYVIVIQGTQAFYIMGFSMPTTFEQDEEVIDEVIHSFHLE